jgi:anti-sigma B factor antagonist
MPTRRFEGDVSAAPGGVRITLHGQLDRDADLAAAYGQAAALADGPIELDFSDVDYINSTGIAQIVGLLTEARRDGRAVQARGLTEHYREIFRITRLSDFMTMLDEQPAPAGAEGGRG